MNAKCSGLHNAWGTNVPKLNWNLLHKIFMKKSIFYQQNIISISVWISCGIWVALFWLNIFYSASRNGCQKAVNNRKRRTQKQPHAWTEKLTHLPPSVFLHICMKIADTQAAVTCLQPVFIYNKAGAAAQLYDINVIISMANIVSSPIIPLSWLLFCASFSLGLDLTVMANYPSFLIVILFVHPRTILLLFTLLSNRGWISFCPCYARRWQ